MRKTQDITRREAIQTTAAALSAAVIASNTSANAADVPAIAGGKPIKTTPFGKAKKYGEAELRHLAEALDQQTLFYSQGKKVKALEAAFAKAQGVKHAVACSSGTAAIHAAMIATGISPGDEVIVTPVTDMGSIIPIL
jgi:perosamine synthetase